MKKIVVFTVLFLMGANNAFAQVVHVPVGGEGTYEQDIPAPGPGEVLTIVVDVPVPKPRKDVAPLVNKTYVTVQKGSNLHLRGGISLGFGIPARPEPSFTAGLVGEVGYAGSPWILEATFRAGNCKEGVALNSGLAAMRSVAKNFRMGVGADLMYCSDVSDHPAEVADERIVGGSVRLQLQQEHFVFGASVGLGAATFPIPGDRKTDPVVYAGLSMSLLF